MNREKCDYYSCKNKVTEDKPPFELTIYNSLKGFNLPTRFFGATLKFCSEECMQNELNARRGQNDVLYYPMMKHIEEKGLYDP